MEKNKLIADKYMYPTKSTKNGCIYHQWHTISNSKTVYSTPVIAEYFNILDLFIYLN